MEWRFLLEGDLLIEFGKKIRLMRKQSGMSQQALAEQIGTTRERIGDIEKGKNTSIIYLFRILKVFNRMSDFENIFQIEEISPKKMYESQQNKRK